jgi:hypothetical protein
MSNASMRATGNKDNFVMHLFHSACEKQTKTQTRYSIQQTTSLIADLSNQHPVASNQQDSAATAKTIQKSPKVTPFENPWIFAFV